MQRLDWASVVRGGLACISIFRDHPFKTSAIFYDFYLYHATVGSFLLLSIIKFGKFLTPSPLKIPTYYMDGLLPDVSGKAVGSADIFSRVRFVTSLPTLQEFSKYSKLTYSCISLNSFVASLPAPRIKSDQPPKLFTVVTIR